MSNFKIIDQFGRGGNRKKENLFTTTHLQAGNVCEKYVGGFRSSIRPMLKKSALAFTHRQGNLSEQAKQISGGSQQWRGKSGSNQVAVNASGRLT